MTVLWYMVGYCRSNSEAVVRPGGPEPDQGNKRFVIAALGRRVRCTMYSSCRSFKQRACYLYFVVLLLCSCRRDCDNNRNC